MSETAADKTYGAQPVLKEAAVEAFEQRHCRGRIMRPHIIFDVELKEFIEKSTHLIFPNCNAWTSIVYLLISTVTFKIVSFLYFNF